MRFVHVWILASCGSAMVQLPAMAAPPAPERRETEDKPTIVVLVNGEVDELLDAALVAISAHTQGRPVELLIERSPVEGSDLREQMKQARALAEQHDASGVFWLDLENDEEFLLYLFEPEGLRVLVRRIPTSVEARPAAIESLGVIVGSSSEAIAAGETIGMTPVEEAVVVESETKPKSTPPPVEEPTVTAEAPPPPPPKPARAWNILRVSLAYTGTSYADQIPWQQGPSLAVSAAVAPRLYVGADYTLLAPSTVETPVRMRIFRHPIAAHFGFQQMLLKWLALDAQLSGGVTLDDWDRVDDSQDGGIRAVASLGAWLHLHFFVVGGLSIDVGVGADAALSVFDYVANCDAMMMTDCPEDLVVIHPHILRGRVRGGVSYSF